MAFVQIYGYLWCVQFKVYGGVFMLVDSVLMVYSGKWGISHQSEVFLSLQEDAFWVVFVGVCMALPIYLP